MYPTFLFPHLLARINQNVDVLNYSSATLQKVEKENKKTKQKSLQTHIINLENVKGKILHLLVHKLAFMQLL